MGYIPPGPQNPFSKDRAYGQQPGFVSRNSGKIFVALAIAVLIGIAWVIINPPNKSDDNSDDTQPISLQMDLSDGDAGVQVMALDER